MIFVSHGVSCQTIQIQFTLHRTLHVRLWNLLKNSGGLVLEKQSNFLNHATVTKVTIFILFTQQFSHGVSISYEERWAGFCVGSLWGVIERLDLVSELNGPLQQSDCLFDLLKWFGGAHKFGHCPLGLDFRWLVKQFLRQGFRGCLVCTCGRPANQWHAEILAEEMATGALPNNMLRNKWEGRAGLGRAK